MSVFERSARVALHAYPDAVRRERGSEILGTLLDLQDAGSLRRMMELVALVTCGLRARRDLTVAGGRAHVWRSTASWLASWLAPILAVALVLRAITYYLEVYAWCEAPQCTYDYDPSFELVGFAALAVVAVATMLAAPVWRRVSVALSVVLLVELTVALTPVVSQAVRVWAAQGGPHLQPALLPASALIAVTCAALATRSRRSKPA